MKNMNRERIKTIVLLFLVAVSVLQISIHWYQQAQGFPFSHIAAFFNKQAVTPDVKADAIKEGYFLPKEIVLSSNLNSQVVLNSGSADYKNIWNDFQNNYLPALLNQKPIKIFPSEMWSSFIGGTYTTRLDFAVEWPAAIVYWIGDRTTRENQGFSTMKSVALLPQKDVNATVNTVYVLDKSAGYVYMYLVSMDSEFLPKAYYEYLNETSSSLVQNGAGVAVSNLNTAYPGSFNAQEDIKIPLSQSSQTWLYTISSTIPDQIVLAKENIDEVQSSILLNLKDSMMPSLDETAGTAVFSDTEYLYKLNSDGLFEYTYLPSRTDAPGDVNAAFINAVSFLEVRNSLFGEAKPFLTSLKTYGNYYEFTFDYRVGDAFIKEIETSEAGEHKITSPILVRATDERVLYCSWLIRSFTEAESLSLYRTHFIEIVERNIREQFYDLYSFIAEGQAVFNAIDVGYVFSQDSNEEEILEPCFIIDTESGDYNVRLYREAK